MFSLAAEQGVIHVDKDRKMCHGQVMNVLKKEDLSFGCHVTKSMNRDGCKWQKVVSSLAKLADWMLKTICTKT